MATTKATKVPSISIITDESVLKALVKSIGVRGKALDKDIHRAAVSALAHGFEHKSTGIAESLMAAMPSIARKNALKVYLMDLGCFLVKEDGKTLGIDSEKRKAGFVHRELALATAPGKYSPEPEAISPLVAMDMVRKLVERLTKAKENGKLDADSISVLEKLSQVAPSVV